MVTILSRHLLRNLLNTRNPETLVRVKTMATNSENCLKLTFGEEGKNIHEFGRRPETVPLPEVLHSCSDFAIINKPYDVTINSEDPTKFTVETLLCRLFPEKIDHNVRHSFRFAHRLDNATSGALVVALNKKAAAKISQSFLHGRVTKHYLALVRGHVSEKRILINIAIGTDTTQEDGVHKMCVQGSPGCEGERQSITKVIVLEKGLYDGDPATKVLLIPVTGRTHQLRVHCKHIGHRIVGDYGYSNRTDVSPYRMMLHAHRLYTKVMDKQLDATAGDPFIPSVDPKWLPRESVTTYNQVISSDSLTFDSVVTLGDSIKKTKLDQSQQYIQEVVR